MFGLAVGIGSTIIAGGMLIPWDKVGSGLSKGWDLTVSYAKSATKSIANTIAKAEAKAKTRIQNARRNIYRFFEIWFDNIGAPILGKSLTRQQAISKVRIGLNVITYFSSDALNVANRAGGSRAMWHQRHGGAGYFNHYHINGHANSSHIYYLIGG